jgi:hypothetical protein
VVAATEPADGEALVLDELQARVSAYGVTQSFELTIDAVPTQGRIEGQRIEEQVDVF